MNSDLQKILTALADRIDRVEQNMEIALYAVSVECWLIIAILILSVVR